MKFRDIFDRKMHPLLMTSKISHKENLHNQQKNSMCLLLSSKHGPLTTTSECGSNIIDNVLNNAHESSKQHPQ